MRSYNYWNVLFLLMAFVLLPACNQPGKTPIVYTDGPEVVPFRALSFNLEDVKLLDGPFLHATKLNERLLLNYEPDRFLANFRKEAGLEPKAEHYGGWESMTISGHSLGHYLTACVLMYKTTGNEEFLNRVHYIVEELALIQEADGDGYIGAFADGKRILEEEVAKGNIRSAGFDLNGIWVPFYTQHKIMMGLMDAYNLCSIRKALDVNVKFADWLWTVVKDLEHEKVQLMLHCEHGGINEALAELYAATGNEKYLEMSKVFHHEAVLNPLSEGIDVLPGLHANTQIPKLIGLARRYELTNDPVDRKTSEFFWERVVNHHSYVTGGHCDHEYFGPPDTLSNRLSNSTTETCNVYNMLKLSEHLFHWDGSPEVADFYERALFNHILSSQHPVDGRVIYNLSLEMGGHKVYQYPFHFTCCVGSGMENHAKYAGSIYYHNHDELFVTQFIASELNWSDKGLKITQLTNFPEEQGTTLEFECEKDVRLALQVRRPYWATGSMQVKVNGKEFKVKSGPGSFVTIDRKWRNGDKVEVSFPFSLRLEEMPDNENRVAVMYGPLVLAGQLGPEDDPAAYDPLYVPVLMVDNRDPNAWMKPLPGEANAFRPSNIGRPEDVIFKPFYATHERRYSVYFDVFTEERWVQFQEEYKAKQEARRRLEAATIDFFQPGEMQPERNHNFKHEKSWVNEFRNRKYREVDRGGWMSCEMQAIKSNQMLLAIDYYGGFQGSKTFDIYANDILIATENVSNARPGEFYTRIYDLPENISPIQEKITIKFVPKEGHRAGPVFGVRTLQKDKV